MVAEKKKVERPRETPLKKDIIEEVREETKKELKRTLQPGVKTTPLPQFINLSKFRFINISSELFREYLYPNGAKIRINDPLRLSVSENNAHRAFDSNGLSYYIPPGWIGIIWKARPGAPNFIM